MWRLSGFADEIDPELKIQLQTLNRVSIRHLELRGVWGKNVLKLTDDELGRIKSTLAAHGTTVSSIGSPIGKIGIKDDFAPHLEQFQRALDVADIFDAPFVRIFSFFIPEGEDPADYRDAVLDRMSQLVHAAAESDVILLHENERHIYGDTPERCHDLLTAINSPRLRAVWDPANFLFCGVRPFADGYDLLRPFISYVHVKDVVADSLTIVPAGEGDSAWPENLAAMRADGFDGFFSLEPHLASGGAFSGFSGPELFVKAADAFKTLLQKEGVAWA